MRKPLTLIAAGAAALAAPAIAQVGVGGTVDATLGTGPVAGTVGNVTDQVGDTVGRVDDTVNGTIDETKLVVAAREQVRAGAQVTDTAGNDIGTVQSIDGDNAVIVDGGKLYNIPLAALYSKADSVTGPLVTKLSKAEIRANAHGSAAARTR
ncbi:hypothetical protein [Sphingopyxis sp.]|uniref:hypothetical protein n=1 Tax=Sphingopyxis sp. TaxID=1908224 RepID=UPI0026183C35|nr:hypothetical protein [Sphingopyxis sp.]MCW0198566.1 hypothetical protein [Sphingopyxis sp.]